VASISITVSAGDIARLKKGLSRVRLAAATGVMGMMPALGELIVRQHKKRIRSEKKSPDGASWPPNIRGNSILVYTGSLAASIHHKSSPFTTRISPGKFRYSRIHQTGGVIRARAGRSLVFSINGKRIHAKRSQIPQRMYMGLSQQNLVEIGLLVDRFAARAFGWLG